MKHHLSMTANGVAHHLQNIKMAAERAAPARTPIDRRQLLLNLSGQELMTFLEPAEAFDDCLIGAAQVGDETVAVYDKLAVIVAMAKHRGVSHEEAFVAFTQSFSANSANRLSDASGKDLPQMPVFMTDLRDIS